MQRKLATWTTADPVRRVDRLLRLIANGHWVSLPLSREALRDAAWGDDHPDSNSLKVHIFNLRKIIDGSFSDPLLHTISGVGFAIKPPATSRADDEIKS